MISRIAILELMLMGWERRKLKKVLFSIHSKVLKRYCHARLTDNHFLIESLYSEVLMLENCLLILEEIRLETDDCIKVLKEGNIQKIEYDVYSILNKFQCAKKEMEPIFMSPYLQKNEERLVQAMSRLNSIIDYYLELEKTNNVFTAEYLVNEAISLKKKAFELLNTKKTYYAKNILLSKIEKYNKHFEERVKK